MGNHDQCLEVDRHWSELELRDTCLKLELEWENRPRTEVNMQRKSVPESVSSNVKSHKTRYLLASLSEL